MKNSLAKLTRTLISVTKAFSGGFRIRDRTKLLQQPSSEQVTGTRSEDEQPDIDEEEEQEEVSEEAKQPQREEMVDDFEDKRIKKALFGINNRYVAFTRRLFRSRSTNSLSEKHSLSDAHVSASCQGSSSSRHSSLVLDSQQRGVGMQRSQSIANLSGASQASNSTNIRVIPEEAVRSEEEIAVGDPAEASEDQEDVGYPETPDIKKYLREVTDCLIKVTQSLEKPDQDPSMDRIDTLNADEGSTVKKTVSFDENLTEHASSEKESLEQPADVADDQAEENNEDEDQDIPSVKTSVIDITNKYLNVTAFLLDPVLTSGEEADSLDEVSRASTVIENKTASLSKEEEHDGDVEPLIVPETASICGSTDLQEDSEPELDIKLEMVKFANEIITITNLMGKFNINK